MQMEFTQNMCNDANSSSFPQNWLIL